MEKSGFIYVWMDKKTKKFYVGRHWGTENDGYVCSSVWMKRAYKRRPEDFKRRIVFRTQDRNALVEEESRWLSMIRENEIRIRYYNLNLHNSPDLYIGKEGLKLTEKVAKATKDAMQRPEVKKKQEIGTRMRSRRYHKRKAKMSPDELKLLSEKRSEINYKWWEIRSPKTSRKLVLKRNSPELLEVYRKKSKELWEKRSEEEKEQVLQKVSLGLKNFYSSENGRKKKETLKSKVSDIWASRDELTKEDIRTKIKTKISDPEHKKQKLKRKAEKQGFYWAITLNDEVSFYGYAINDLSRNCGIGAGNLNLWVKQGRLEGISRKGQKYMIQKVPLK